MDSRPSDRLCPRLSVPSEPRTDSSDWAGGELDQCNQEVSSNDLAHDNQFIRAAGHAANQVHTQDTRSNHGEDLILPDHLALVPWNIEDPDANIRALVAKWLLTVFSLFLLTFMAALVAATFARVPTEAFSGYFQWATSGLMSLVTLMLGYYFGARHVQGQGNKR